MSKKHKGHHEEEHENAERWLITYADLITLLLALFVVLYSTAEQDTKKFKRALGAFSAIFGPSPFEGEGNAKVLDWKPPAPPPIAKIEDNKPITLEDLQKRLKSLNVGEGVSTQMNERGLTISIADHLFFDSGKDLLKNDAMEILDKIGKSLNEIQNAIRIEGHTDNKPIRSKKFPSNWHLSTARANRTAEYLIAHAKVSMLRVHVAGYADNVPLASNDTPEGRAKNRRVEIVIIKGEKGLDPAAARKDADRASGESKPVSNDSTSSQQEGSTPEPSTASSGEGTTPAVPGRHPASPAPGEKE